MRARFGKFTLVDSRNGIPLQDLRINGQRAVQTEQYPEGESPENFDRANRQKVVTFRTERQHASDEIAQRFCALYDQQLPIVDDLILEGTRGGWRLFIPGAALVSVDSSVMGCRSYHSFQLVGGTAQTKGGTT